VRTIKKNPQPAKLAEWRTPRMLANHLPATECDYESLRKAAVVLEAVENGLFAEQGGICAYTGHQISITPVDPNSGINRDVGFHVEHLTPQDHCTYGQDADYMNLVACWPRPNCGFEPAYGAKKKDNWPAPAEQGLFVSPLRPDCSSRFTFNHRGEIAAARNNDTPAETTIEKLGLDHHTLTELRRNAIRGVLNPASRQIKLAEARRLLADMKHAAAQLNAGIPTKLLPFCFAIEPALQREIRKLEGIMKLRH
jgi:uncharacterized protein (TIGR02646 family)